MVSKGFTRSNRASSGCCRALWRAWLGLLLAAVAMTAVAAQVEGLYTTWVPIADQQEATRDLALQTALARVFVKVSGKRTAFGDPKLSLSLPTASALVQQYRYESRPQPGDGQNSLGLWVQFDAALINELLRAAGLRTWGRIRPTVLPWIAVGDGDKRSLIGGEQQSLAQSDRIAILDRVGNRRGISILVPLLDLQDQSTIDVAHLGRDPESSIRAASVRYSPEAILVGLVRSQADRLWEANWTLYVAGVKQSWATVDDSMELVIEAGIEQCIDLLATHYIEPTLADDHSTINVVVTGIRGFGDYATALHALQQPERTTSVHVNRLHDGDASFSVDITGAAQGLLNVVTMGGVLVPDTSASISQTEHQLRLQIAR